MKSTLLLFLGSLLTFLMPIQGLLLLVIGVVLLDTASGVYAAIKLNGRKAFRSGVLFNIAPKLFMYVGTTLLLYMTDTFIFQTQLFSIQFLLTKSISMIWVYTELKSIDENSQKLGNKPFLDNARDVFKIIKNFKKDINNIS
jgi:hypothetical protein